MAILDDKKSVSKNLAYWAIGVAVVSMLVMWIERATVKRFKYDYPVTVTEVGPCARNVHDRQVCAIRVDSGNSFEVDRIYMVGDTLYRRCYFGVDKSTKEVSAWCFADFGSYPRNGTREEARLKAEAYARELKG